jgi:hypothetical protein
MARLVPALVIGSVAAAAAACTVAAPPTDDPSCQILADGEKSPGYPYDLARYRDDVLPRLVAGCSTQGCHGAPQGQGNFTVWADAAPGNCGFAQTFNSLASHIDLTTPKNSSILVAISGALPTHPLQYADGSAELAAIADYIQDASARWQADGGGTTPPPGASPFDYAIYQQVIQPILDGAEGRGCATSGCHGTGAGGFTLVAAPAPGSPEMEANFIAVTGRANLNEPASSLVLLRALTRHASGTSAVISAGQGEQLRAWVEDAKANAGDGGPVGCAPLDRFNLGVFRDEILPILRGTIDLNRAGAGGTTVGCMRGPCHGTDRGPGGLHLSDALPVASNLQNFACFVDLISPSSSEILLCPLDDPRCRRSPHPGQDVFTGAADLNYQRLLAFLFGSRVDASPVDFAFFVRRVNPIFNDINAVEGGAQGRTCADTVACHGVSVAGQAAPNGSNFPIIPNAADKARLTFNFTAAASFINFLSPDQSSLFLYPTNEIANTRDNPLATGLPHPGGRDFAVDSVEARTILRWAAGLRPDNQGFVTDWLVAGDYAASRIVDPTPIDEAAATPSIFDPSGAPQFNAGQWDGLFSASRVVDLNLAFPRAATAGRVAYAVVYVVNTTGLPITAQATIVSPNAIRVYADASLVAQAEDARAGASALIPLPSYAASRKATRVLVKVFQRANDPEFSFSVQLRDELGNLLTDTGRELVFLLGPQGGI